MKLATHEPHELAANGQTQAGAAGSLVLLAELLVRLKNSVQLVGGDADAGVVHREVEPPGRRSVDCRGPRIRGPGQLQVHRGMRFSCWALRASAESLKRVIWAV